MKKIMLKKELVIGIIILFFVASVIPSLGAKSLSNNEKMTNNDSSVQPLFEGASYFILLSDYTDGGGQDNKWAVQLRFDSDGQVVECEYDGISLPLITDQWTEIRVEINLNTDWMEIYYDDDLLHEKAWTAGPNNNGDGLLNIAAVDLYANSATSVYYDDLSLEEVGGSVVWSDNFDSYDDGSSMHGQGGWKGWDNDEQFTAYVSSDENLSSPHSVDIEGNSDLAHEFSGYTSGEYVFIAWIYISDSHNNAPATPIITGPTIGEVGVEYEYEFTTIDPNGDDVYFYIEWDDGDIMDWNGPHGSGEKITFRHSWDLSGDYTIIAKAKDILDAESGWSSFDVTITNPPGEPEVDGPSKGKKDKMYDFTFHSTDPDGDNVRYLIDWGDNKTVLTAYFPSCTVVTFKHSWIEDGVYIIKAKAIDINKVESDITEFEITIPRSRSITFDMFDWLFEQFPYTYLFIKHIFGLH
jgi:hypothetical protein